MIICIYCLLFFFIELMKFVLCAAYILLLCCGRSLSSRPKGEPYGQGADGAGGVHLRSGRIFRHQRLRKGILKIEALSWSGCINILACITRCGHIGPHDLTFVEEGRAPLPSSTEESLFGSAFCQQHTSTLYSYEYFFFFCAFWQQRT